MVTIYLSALPPPRSPDPLVFGDWHPRSDPVPTVGVRRLCPEHPGVQWHGAAECWACEAAT